MSAVAATEPVARWALPPGVSSPAPDQPLVSVYLPTQNRPELVERAIRSVLEQDYPNIQLVVVDDGSAPETMDTLRKLGRENRSSKSITVLRLEEARGACHARNLALAHCQGQYTTGLDDDDYFLPDRISRLIAAFEPATSAFVFGGYVRETHLPGGHTRRTIIPLRQTARLERLLKQNIVGNQVFTLTERFHAVGGFDERLPAWQDHDMWIRLVKAFGDGKPAGGATYVHTVDDSVPSISRDTGKIEKAYDLFIQKHAEYAEARLLLCLRLAKLRYGINVLSASDLPLLLRLGEPRLTISSLYYYLANGGLRKIFR